MMRLAVARGARSASDHGGGAIATYVGKYSELLTKTGRGSRDLG
jgi:hypothetical protein